MATIRHFTSDSFFRKTSTSWENETEIKKQEKNVISIIRILIKHTQTVELFRSDSRRENIMFYFIDDKLAGYHGFFFT